MPAAKDINNKNINNATNFISLTLTEILLLILSFIINTSLT